MRVTFHEAQVHLAHLLDLVAQGGEVVIERDGQPVAKLVPNHQPRTPRVPGGWAGRVWIADDFDDDLPEDVAAAFRGDRP